MISIRHENSGDKRAIRKVNELAFDKLLSIILPIIYNVVNVRVVNKSGHVNFIKVNSC